MMVDDEIDDTYGIDDREYIMEFIYANIYTYILNIIILICM